MFPTMKKYILSFGLICLVVIFIGSFWYFSENKTNIKNVDKINIDVNDPNSVTAAVSSLMELPNEKPTVATVSNLKILEGQPFFKKASIGDKILIFTISKKAIIYSPQRHIIVEVAPLNIETSNNY